MSDNTVIADTEGRLVASRVARERAEQDFADREGDVMRLTTRLEDAEREASNLREVSIRSGNALYAARALRMRAALLAAARVRPEDILGERVDALADQCEAAEARAEKAEAECDAVRADAKALATALRQTRSTFDHSADDWAGYSHHREILISIDAALAAHDAAKGQSAPEKRCTCQNEHRRGYCREPSCPYYIGPFPDDVGEIASDRQAFFDGQNEGQEP